MPMLALSNVSKRFGALTVADAVSFELRQGEALGIIGPNGAGKSTLFNLITGNISADAGTIVFDGRDVTRLPPMQRCFAGVGRSFQIPQPFEKLTVFENLLVAGAFGARKTESRGRRPLRRNLVETGLIERQPSGQRRAAAARRRTTSRFGDRRLLLLDEIAGGLTEGECGMLVDTIRAIHKGGMSIIWIEHVLHALNSVVERLLVLNFGKVIGMGVPDAVMASREVREIYLGIEV